MTLGQQIITVDDTALPPAASGRVVPIVAGMSTEGTTATSPDHVVTCRTPKQVRDAFGVGPLVTEASYIARFGGLVHCLRLGDATGDDSNVEAWDNSGSTNVTASDGTGTAPTDRYSIRIECVEGGARGTATIRYSLDAWPDNPTPTYSEPVVTADEVTLGESGVVVAFDDETFTTSDVFTATTTPPAPAASDITALETNSVLRTFDGDWRFILIAGANATATAAQLLFAALDPVLADLESDGLNKYGLLGTGYDASANQSNITYEGIRLSGAYNEASVVASNPGPGLGLERVSAASVIAARIAGNLISTDPMRVASGALPGVVGIGHDEWASPGVDDRKISTLRTRPLQSGFFVSNSWIKSAANSSVRYTQHANVIATACEIVALAQSRYEGASLRTGAGGAINEGDARDIERDVFAQLSSALLQPRNAEGTRGHVSAISYTIDRSTNVLSTEEVQAELQIQPLGYPRVFRTTIGFRVLPA